jgi:hypothetical protein
MGFCDYITLEKEYPQHGLRGGSECHSKSLFASEAKASLASDSGLT